MRQKNIYQIHIRQFLNVLGKNKKIRDIPVKFWIDLKHYGITSVWLMGIWQLPPHETIMKYASSEIMMQEYKKVLPDVTDSDICGSLFAIDKYEIDETLGTQQELSEFKELINNLGLELILDFIPNHFHRESSIFLEHPEIFLKQSGDIIPAEGWFNYQSSFYAHGKDPHYPSWLDTVQIDYSKHITRDFMKKQMLKITDMCDGFRCDMSMLILKDVYKETWGQHIDSEDLNQWNVDFWSESLSEIKLKYPTFTTIAEVYWDLENKLVELGFDYVYDKVFLDTIMSQDMGKIISHIKEHDMTKRLTFLENHDEERITHFKSGLELEKAILLQSVMPIKLYQHGQFTGEKTRFPIQLKRTIETEKNQEIVNFYSTVLGYTKN